jgi:hypothetical protein
MRVSTDDHSRVRHYQVAGSLRRLPPCAFKEKRISIFWRGGEAYAARCAWDRHGHTWGRVQRRLYFW